VTLPARPATQAPVPAERLPVETLELIRRGVWLIAFRDLRDDDLANDAAQETVARLLEAVDRDAAAIANPAGYARGIARHVIADTRAGLARRQPIEAVADSYAHAVSVDPLAETMRREERDRVRAAFATLSRADREVLRTLYAGNLTPGELASRNGEPPERVRKRKSRALERLRQAFFGHAEAPSRTSEGTPHGDGS